MKKSCHFVLIFALAMGIFLALKAGAQQTPYVVGSNVTGTVFCADTNAPARFAKVLLKSTQGNHTGEDFVKNLQNIMGKSAAKNGQPGEPVKQPSDDQKKALAAAARGMNQATDMLNSSTVGLDGGFSFAGIKAGTYYVHAILPGYIDPFSQIPDDDFDSTDPAVRALIAQIPTITVSGTDSAHVNLRLERGAAVSGRILYEDGSPAAGWTLSVVKPGAADDGSDAASALMTQALAMSGAAQISKTDDLGHYRISGIAAGDYSVRGTLIATAIGISANNIGDGGSGISLTVYSGDTFSHAAAKVVTLTAGEEHAGVDITVPDRSLHNIIGHVVAKSDSHTLNVGMVSLTCKDNPSLHMKAAIRDDGSFHFEYLPGGFTYTVKVDDAEEGKITPGAGNFMGMNIPNQEILHKYGTDTTDVALGHSDIDDLRLTVAQTDWTPSAKKAGEPDVNPAELLNGLFGVGANDSANPPKP